MIEGFDSDEAALVMRARFLFHSGGSGGSGNKSRTVGRYSTRMLVKRNLSEGAPGPLDMPGTKDVAMRILVGRSDGAPNFSMRQFRVAAGGFTPRHTHDYEHEVVVVGGQGTVEYDGSDHPLREGDVLLVAPNVLHQFRADCGDELRFLCFVPVSFDCGKPTPGA